MPGVTAVRVARVRSAEHDLGVAVDGREHEARGDEHPQREDREQQQGAVAVPLMERRAEPGVHAGLTMPERVGVINTAGEPVGASGTHRGGVEGRRTAAR